MKLFNFYRNLFREVGEIKIIKFSLQKNLWTLDLIAILCFAVNLAYIVHTDSDLSKSNPTNWGLIFYETLGYIIAFVLGITLQRKFTRIRSWVWIGIVGATFRFLIMEFVYSHSIKAFSEEMFSQRFFGAVFNWLFWMMLGLMLIFAVRFFAYFVLAIYNFFGKRVVNLR